MPPFASKDIVDCHHESTLFSEIPDEQNPENPARQSTAGVRVYVKLAPSVVPDTKRTAAHLGVTRIFFSSSDLHAMKANRKVKKKIFIFIICMSMFNNRLFDA